MTLSNKGKTLTALRATAGQLMPSATTLSVAANASNPGTVLRALQRLRRPLLLKSSVVTAEAELEFFERNRDVKRRASFGAVFIVAMELKFFV